MHKIVTALNRTTEPVPCTWGEGPWAVPTSQKPTRNNAQGFAGAVGSESRCTTSARVPSAGGHRAHGSATPGVCMPMRREESVTAAPNAEKKTHNVLSIGNALQNAFCSL